MSIGHQPSSEYILRVHGYTPSSLDDFLLKKFPRFGQRHWGLGIPSLGLLDVGTSSIGKLMGFLQRFFVMVATKKIYLAKL